MADPHTPELVAPVAIQFVIHQCEVRCAHQAPYNIVRDPASLAVEIEPHDGIEHSCVDSNLYLCPICSIPSRSGACLYRAELFVCSLVHSNTKQRHLAHSKQQGLGGFLSVEHLLPRSIKSPVRELRQNQYLGKYP